VAGGAATAEPGAETYKQPGPGDEDPARRHLRRRQREAD
jgi:hypothetical protein